MSRMVFDTERLIVRKAASTPEDVNLFYSLWTNPQVMTFVGFPQGLKITRDDIHRQIEQHPDSEYDQKLVIVLKADGILIGECKLGLPDETGISETDIKLLPDYWGHGYGKEIKQALVDYLFTHTECKAIRATPNQNNLASQKMQEAVGAVPISEGVHHFPPRMQDYTIDVPYIIYEVTRDTWDRRRSQL